MQLSCKLASFGLAKICAIAVCATTAIASTTLLSQPALAQTVKWVQQLNINSGISRRVATDKDGNVYIAGDTNGSNVFVAKYDTNGTLLWTRQFDTAISDFFGGIATDKDGNVYVAGYNDQSRRGPSVSDGFVLKYDSNGNLLWQQNLAGSQGEYFTGVATDKRGNVYVTGYSDSSQDSRFPVVDALVLKYDSNGNLLWQQKYATPKNDYPTGIAADKDGNVYISGRVDDRNFSNPGADANIFVAKYDTNGTQLWTQQLATSEQEESNDVVTDKRGNVYIAGYKGSNALVVKYDTSGSLLWQQQLVSPVFVAYGIDTDKRDDIYITGYNNAGSPGAFVVKYDTNGTVLWQQQLQFSGSVTARGVATDKRGGIYITGIANGTFVVKYEE